MALSACKDCGLEIDHTWSHTSRCKKCHNAMRRSKYKSLAGLCIQVSGGQPRLNPNETPVEYAVRLASYNSQYRARKREATIERVDFGRVYIRDEGICHICGEYSTIEETEFDHVIPLSRGGEHSYANVKVSHSVCNRKKSNKVAS